jgi:hypothetical protein
MAEVVCEALSSNPKLPKRKSVHLKSSLNLKK